MEHQETGNAAGYCPFRVERPVMRQRWARLTFLHWSFEPEAVQRLLPDGLVADLFDGVAWVGLVPFFMHVGTGGGLQVPWISRFCETNVRTYVRDEQGRAGIWFFSLDAARLGAVVVARTTYRLPYFWSAMRITQHGHPGPDGQDGDLPDEIAYSCRRRLPGVPGHRSPGPPESDMSPGDRALGKAERPLGPALPGPRDATSAVRVRVGDRYQPGELTERDHFLTARWILFSIAGAAGAAEGSGPSRSRVSPDDRAPDGRAPDDRAPDDRAPGEAVSPRASTGRRLARACHDPWPLYRAEALVVRDRLITAAGLPAPQGAPLVHYSPGVDVAIGRPERSS